MDRRKVLKAAFLGSLTFTVAAVIATAFTPSFLSCILIAVGCGSTAITALFIRILNSKKIVIDEYAILPEEKGGMGAKEKEVFLVTSNRVDGWYLHVECGGLDSALEAVRDVFSSKAIRNVKIRRR